LGIGKHNPVPSTPNADDNSDLPLVGRTAIRLAKVFSLRTTARDNSGTESPISSDLVVVAHVSAKSIVDVSGRMSTSYAQNRRTLGVSWMQAELCYLNVVRFQFPTKIMLIKAGLQHIGASVLLRVVHIRDPSPPTSPDVPIQQTHAGLGIRIDT